MQPRPAPCDPTHPGHRTTDAWVVAGPWGWFHKAFVSAWAHGEARGLWRAGAVRRWWWDAQARRVQGEELATPPLAPEGLQ